MLCLAGEHEIAVLWKESTLCAYSFTLKAGEGSEECDGGEDAIAGSRAEWAKGGLSPHEKTVTVHLEEV